MYVKVNKNIYVNFYFQIHHIFEKKYSKHIAVDFGLISKNLIRYFAET